MADRYKHWPDQFQICSETTIGKINPGISAVYQLHSIGIIKKLFQQFFVKVDKV